MPPFPSILAAALLVAAPAPEAAREIGNVAAFARLYGVVRFFYPSDAAAALDWDRFAVTGTSRVRLARNPGELGIALRALVAPLGPGIEIATSLPPPPAPVSAPGEPLVAWRYLGAGFSPTSGAYKAKRTHRAPPASADGFVTLMQTVPAEALRGKAIRLRGKVRATAAGDAAGGALWLRVDRPNQVMGFFDNMGDRVVRDPEWRSYAVEGAVADDAESVAFGVMAVGVVTADFDALELAVRDVGGGWTPIPVADPGFEAVEGEQGGWFRSGTGNAAVSRPRAGAPEGAQYARFSPPSPGAADVELFPEGGPTPGARVDLDLGSGLRARVPLALTDAQARAVASAPPGAAETSQVDERLSDVIVAWAVLRHFYPYWAEAGVDWDGRLEPHLEAARAADSRSGQLDVLRALVADARDGHGFVGDTRDRSERGTLPVGLAVVEGRLAVVSSSVPREAPVGAVVTAIDDAPVAQRLAREEALASGSPQWRDVKAMWGIMDGPRGATVRLRIDAGGGPVEVSLAYAATPAPPASRPEALSEPQPGVFYADLTRAKMAEVAPMLAALAAARGVVFDMRGYPTDAGFGILPHLLDAPEADRWMHVAKIVGPFYETAGWQGLGWDAKPAKPRIAGNVVFLTDGRAISYAESVMGYVADRKLGTIVGGTTAGTNGNVATFLTPGGFSVGFTGMRVTRHDGRSPHHLVGVRPDVALAPTIAGLRAGRDEVLERGLAIAGGTTPRAADP